MKLIDFVSWFLFFHIFMAFICELSLNRHCGGREGRIKKVTVLGAPPPSAITRRMKGSGMHELLTGYI